MGKKVLSLPQPTDAEGNILSPEQVEQLSDEPTYVPINMEINGNKAIFYVAVDFDQVDKDADHSYQLMKAKQFALATGTSVSQAKKPANSKFTNLKDDSVEKDEESFDGEQYVRMIEMEPKQRAAFLGLIFPVDYANNPVILEGGYNVPGMPDFGQLKTWFEKGGRTSSIVLDELVMAYDPTGLLATMKKAKTTPSKESDMTEKETSSTSPNPVTSEGISEQSPAATDAELGQEHFPSTIQTP